MTVSPRDIQSPHYCYRAQRYGFLWKPPNITTKYNIDYQLININQVSNRKNISNFRRKYLAIRIIMSTFVSDFEFNYSESTKHYKLF